MDNLLNIQRVLFSCSSLDQIDFEDLGKKLSWDDQKAFLDQTALHPLLIQYPIKRSFLIHFMKRLIEGIERHSPEVHDDLYNFFCEIKTRQNTEEHEKFVYKHFIYNEDGQKVTIKEATSLISNGTTGLCTWEAAIKLAEWAIDHKIDLEKKNILELGSGIGFAGICIAKVCQPSCLYLTDCHTKVLDLLKQNISINELNDVVKVLNLSWGETLEGVAKVPDYLLASDIIYDDSLFEPLLDTVNKIFDLNRKCKFILACTVRNEETLKKFLDLLRSCDKMYHIEEEGLAERNEFQMISPNINSVVKMYRITLDITSSFTI